MQVFTLEAGDFGGTGDIQLQAASGHPAHLANRTWQNEIGADGELRDKDNALIAGETIPGQGPTPKAFGVRRLKRVKRITDLVIGHKVSLAGPTRPTAGGLHRRIAMLSCTQTEERFG